jgi:hypothetical protein
MSTDGGIRQPNVPLLTDGAFTRIPTAFADVPIKPRQRARRLFGHGSGAGYNMYMEQRVRDDSGRAMHRHRRRTIVQCFSKLTAVSLQPANLSRAASASRTSITQAWMSGSSSANGVRAKRCSSAKRRHRDSHCGKSVSRR